MRELGRNGLKIVTSFILGPSYGTCKGRKTSKIELLRKQLTKALKPLPVFAKSSMLDIFFSFQCFKKHGDSFEVFITFSVILFLQVLKTNFYRLPLLNFPQKHLLHSRGFYLGRSSPTYRAVRLA